MRIRMRAYDESVKIDGKRVIDLFGDNADIERLVDDVTDERTLISRPGSHSNSQPRSGAVRLLIEPRQQARVARALRLAIAKAAKAASS